MEKSGRSLILDGNKIKDDEIRKLLNVDTYQTYKSAFSQVGTGNFFLYTGFITAAAGLFIRFAHKEKEAYITCPYMNRSMSFGEFQVFLYQSG